MEIDREKLRKDIENTKLPFACYVDFQAVLDQNKGLTPEAIEFVFFEIYCDPSLDGLDKEARIAETCKLLRTKFREKFSEIKTLKLLTTSAKELYDMVEKVVVKRGKISTDTKYFEFHIDDKVNGRKGVFSIPSDKLLKFDSFKEYFFKAFDVLPPIVVPSYKYKWAWDEFLRSINNNMQTVEDELEESQEVLEARALIARISEKGVTHGQTNEELADVEAGHLLHIHKSSGAVQTPEKNKVSYFITSSAVAEIIEGNHYHTSMATLSRVMSELGFKESGTHSHRLGATSPRCWELKKEVVDLIKSGDYS